ncbi:MAG: SPOR domain-containing protein [Pseudomonadota bacterium]|nr:SPOR domain-containing protein [Gammaproteobacteria bacterium]MBU1558378.1 SPOR domain-containing protein [Gammaproteobacteria bacterium]MBU1629108.1 SPOR domain-containing protein [Gammaproteobacteria bacterium]MBU1927087.1 SPOR domain-containing protein [Gammaproteobacteria bacterium]MBU2546471.1 SPOR domain-containing protein [Gammaproteobacteria bacterium]
MLLLILLIFAFVSGILFVTHRLRSQRTTTRTTQIKIKKLSKKIPSSTQAKNTAPSMHYDFYKMLPSMQVDVLPEANEMPVSKENSPFYVLQFASFSDKEVASSYEDKIRLLGFDAKVIPIARGDSMIYRVQLGPFQDELSAEKIRDELQSQGINGILVTLTPRKNP